MVKDAVNLFAEIIIKDSKKKVIKRRKFISKSFVIGFLQLLQSKMFGTVLSVIDTGNTARTTGYADSTYMQLGAAAGTDVTGTVVGTGTNAVNISDYALQTKIAHGTASGQLQYGAVTFGAPTISGSDIYFTVTRNFVNNSGDSITVNEIGMYGMFYTSGTRYACLVRDVVAGGVAVADGQTLTLNYTIKITVA